MAGLLGQGAPDTPLNLEGGVLSPPRPATCVCGEARGAGGVLSGGPRMPAPSLPRRWSRKFDCSLPVAWGSWRWKRPKLETPMDPVAWGRGSGVGGVGRCAAPGGDWGPPRPPPSSASLPSSVCDLETAQWPPSMAVICSGLNGVESGPWLGRRPSYTSSHTSGIFSAQT